MLSKCGAWARNQAFRDEKVWFLPFWPSQMNRKTSKQAIARRGMYTKLIWRAGRPRWGSGKAPRVSHYLRFIFQGSRREKIENFQHWVEHRFLKSFYCVQGFLYTFVYFINLVINFRNPHEVAVSKIGWVKSYNINGISGPFVRKLSSSDHIPHFLSWWFYSSSCSTI